MIPRLPRARPPIAMVMGIALLVFAGPRAISAEPKLGADAAPGRLQRSAPVTLGGLDRLAAGPGSAVERAGSGRNVAGLGIALLARSRFGGPASERHALLDDAIVALRRGLSLAPANGWAWLALAQADFDRSGASPKTARALHMSIRTSPLDRRLMFDRLRLALALWDHFDAKGRAAVAAQARMARRRDPRRLTELAERSGMRLLIRRLVADDGIPGQASAVE